MNSQQSKQFTPVTINLAHLNVPKIPPAPTFTSFDASDDIEFHEEPTMSIPVVSKFGVQGMRKSPDKSFSVNLDNIPKEEAVLRRILDDTNLQSRIAPHIDPVIFTGMNRGIAEAIVAFTGKHKRFPNPNELMNAALPDQAPERIHLQKIMAYNVDTIGTDLQGMMVTSYFRNMLTQKILMDAASTIHDGKIEGMNDIVANLAKTVNFNLDVDVGLSARKDMAEIIRRLNESSIAIPSGIADICVHTTSDNKVPNGGWYRSAISLFMGMPNVGKSILLCNEAAYAYRCGYNVLYISLEMAEEYIHQRVIANVCNVEMKDVKHQNPDELLALYEANIIKDAKPGNFIVKKMPTSTTVVEIEAMINEVMRTDGIPVDLLIVDYIGIMKPMKRANTLKNLDMYTMGKEIAEQLRDLACKYRIACLSASQMNRDGYSNIQSSLQNTAGSAGINDVADFMITINQDQTLAQLKMFLHTILKNRFGEKNVSFLTECDYSHMHVQSPSKAKSDEYTAAQSSQPQQVPLFTYKPGQLEFESRVKNTDMNDEQENILKKMYGTSTKSTADIDKIEQAHGISYKNVESQVITENTSDELVF